jgi:hypothetical protein
MTVAESNIKPNGAKSAPFDIPKFEILAFEMPAALRELAENGAAQAKENCDKMKSATHEMSAMVQASYATAAQGTTDFGLKVFEMMRANTHHGFEFIEEILTTSRRRRR